MALVFRTRLALIGALLTTVSFCQEWTVFNMSNSPLPSVTVKALASDGSGGLWIGTDWGLCHFDGNSAWDLYQEGNTPLAENDINCLRTDVQGRLWIGTVAAGLQVKDGDDWVTYTTANSPVPENGIRDLFIEPSGTAWMCTSGGLARFDGVEWAVYDDTPESHDGAILNTGNTRSVAVRGDGTICLGSFNGGFHFIQGSTVDVLTTFEDGFFDNTAVDVLIHPQTGDRWVATPAAGLLRQQGPVVGGLWTQWNGSVGFPSNATSALAVDDDGAIWTGTQIEGIVKVMPSGNFEQFNTGNSGMPDNDVRSILVADDGAIWVGTFYGGLARFDQSVGILDGGDVSNWVVGPNPARDHVSVFCRRACGGARWTLNSMDGSVVAEGLAGAGGDVIPLRRYAAGCYILQLAQEGLVERRKIFVEAGY